MRVNIYTCTAGETGCGTPSLYIEGWKIKLLMIERTTSVVSDSACKYFWLGKDGLDNEAVLISFGFLIT